MAGTKYKCDTCGIERWSAKVGPCVNDACDGTMCTVKNKVPKEWITCANCGKRFKPKNRRVRTCSPECSHELALFHARNRARRKPSEEEPKPMAVETMGDPWATDRPLYGDGDDDIFAHDSRCGTDPLPTGALPDRFSMVAS